MKVQVSLLIRALIISGARGSFRLTAISLVILKDVKLHNAKIPFLMRWLKCIIFVQILEDN